MCLPRATTWGCPYGGDGHPSTSLSGLGHPLREMVSLSNHSHVGHAFLREAYHPPPPNANCTHAGRAWQRKLAVSIKDE